MDGIDPVLGQQGRYLALDLILLLVHGALGEIDAPQRLFQREGEPRQHLGIPLLPGVCLKRRLAGGVELGGISAATTGAERASQIVAAVNAKSSDSGVFAREVKDDTGAVTGYQLFADTALDVATGGNLAGLAGASAALGVVTAAATASVYTLGDNGTTDGININSFGDSQLAMKVIDNAINAINSSRADLGALQSRFENAVANIQITGENISAARGRIVDADFAKETSNLSRAQILQQAGTAMVAQANQAQQGVLSLLR